jgi:hypothetical protein
MKHLSQSKMKKENNDPNGWLFFFAQICDKIITGD